MAPMLTRSNLDGGHRPGFIGAMNQSIFVARVTTVGNYLASKLSSPQIVIPFSALPPRRGWPRRLSTNFRKRKLADFVYQKLR